MKKTIMTLFALIAFQPISFASTSSATNKDLINKLGFRTGQYEVLIPETQASYFCESEILNFETAEDKDKISIVIGSKLIFPAINKSSVVYDSNINCKTTQTNLIENNSLTITQSEICKGKKNKSDSKIFKFKFSDELIILSLIENKQTTSCHYKKIKANQVEK